MIVYFKNKQGGMFVGKVVRETKKLFYYVQVAGLSKEFPPVRVPKSRCEVLEK